MKFAALFWIIATLSFAAENSDSLVSQKLANGDLAYYGQNFKTTIHTKTTLFDILTAKHVFIRDNYDQLNACSPNAKCYEHTPVTYTQARMILFGQIHTERDTSGRKFITDVYCHKKFTYDRVVEFNGRDDVNIEHSWPQSKFNKQFNLDLQKTDMHHLYPSDKVANAKRANFPFGQYEEGTHDDLNLSDCTISHLFQDGNSDYFNPPKEHLGNVARSLFYFSVRYKLAIDAKQERTLRQWHKADPVDAAELSRHEQIAQAIFVRNPFIDYPELVDKLTDF